MPFMAGGFTKTVEVPDLQKADPEQAKAQLAEIGLVMVMDTLPEYNQKVEAGKIIKSRPVATARVKKGRRVWVTISKGLKQVELPDLKGYSVRQCEITLQQMGLKLGEVIWSKKNGIPVGVIFGSEPGAGTVIEPNSVVNLLASSGGYHSTHVTPKLIGMSLNKTKDYLSKLNLNLGQIEYRESQDQLPNTVLEQTPVPGLPLKTDVTINLIVSK